MRDIKIVSYEDEKETIRRKAQSPEEYERMIKDLCTKLNI